jgi:hypothetical protein
MTTGRRVALLAGASLSLLLVASPVFAQGSSNNNGSVEPGSVISGSTGGGTCSFYVTNLQVVSAQFPLTTLELGITVEDSNDPGTWYFPDPSQVSNNPQALPQIEIFQNGKPVTGSEVAKKLDSKPIPSVTKGQSATADYTFDVSPTLQSGNYTVELVANNAGHVFHMYNSSNENGTGVGTAPVCLQVPPPYGQLPEVPFAAGIPLVGIGAGAFLWYRRRQVPEPPQV